MCGIFGYIASSCINKNEFETLTRHARQRGRDSSGLMVFSKGRYSIFKADYDILRLAKEVRPHSGTVALGHSRLITNGLSDNQPVYRDDVAVFHNGIVVNDEAVWKETRKERTLSIDTETIAALAAEGVEAGLGYEAIGERILKVCKGTISAAILFRRQGKLLLLSNNGSLYVGTKQGATIFHSEAYPLRLNGCEEVRQLLGSATFDVPASQSDVSIVDKRERKYNIIPGLGTSTAEEWLLEYRVPKFRRCTKCLLPETMPFISFDDKGVCNYCNNYKLRNNPRPKKEIFDLIEPYRRSEGTECIVPFSGGRDSSYALHLIVNELKMKAVTYTYDWGMVTDLARRNISRMCSKLGVENIIVAADIEQKRRFIRKNLTAWLKHPHLGMISILTAGDKHFFRYIENIKRQTGVSLNLWGINPLEVTHFKAGFLGIPPYFEENRVYTHGVMKQLRYQSLRLRQMVKSPGYFNESMWDTLLGEFFRSFHKKSDYYHVFDYWRWDEKQIDDTLIGEYEWETAPDTKTTWRIGDGTAAFYNYIYYTVAGFTEHDTFRSNQIREGQMTREEALPLVIEENRTRYPNIKWYLDAVGLDYKPVIETINRIPKLYQV